MAASRGERANMMTSASRRRNKSESPKYGYNLGRSMPYRSIARNNVLPLHSSASSTLPPGAYTSYGLTPTTTTPYHESHHLSSSQAAHANLPSSSTSVASSASPPPFHRTLPERRCIDCRHTTVANITPAMRRQQSTKMAPVSFRHSHLVRRLPLPWTRTLTYSCIMRRKRRRLVSV
ncbi:uncharacterized protein LOC120770631 [Bactrocera tryoni]|uniref:uncharacterized protein LOC120770631 n=1 Tax=Bactrocera tryoni TaxID=59916 RepID=UPI001A9662D2|nr:uncharacterized protein LOC120770631 [Bactrocera tryoni]